MATESMIAAACRNPTRAVGISNPDATLYRPRGYEDVEAEERAKAARSVVRMALGRHSCPDLAACARHGRELGRRRACKHPQHVVDMAVALEVLEALGLKDGGLTTHRKCSTCHLSKSVERFPKGRDTCKTCLHKKSKAGREGQS